MRSVLALIVGDGMRIIARVMMRLRNEADRASPVPTIRRIDEYV